MVTFIFIALHIIALLFLWPALFVTIPLHIIVAVMGSNNRKSVQEASSYSDNNSLHEAVLENKILDVKQLIDCEIDVNATNHNNWTALHFAANSGYVDIARLLIKHGADVEAVTHYKKTALDIAQHKGHMHKDKKYADMVQLLATHSLPSLDDSSIPK